ncbi:Hypothetical predicted protein [Xyrichtys novacula]|uniref:Uncharacterized protein n=1 Tax=Xyrichtys novacula TaxID=13765 RepID=A0AAV1HKE4_XYRNO|nr:Hypothetical predicted protein [Xyrichtys novacula]
MSLLDVINLACHQVERTRCPPILIPPLLPSRLPLQHLSRCDVELRAASFSSDLTEELESAGENVCEGVSQS